MIFVVPWQLTSDTEFFLGVDGGQSTTKALIGDATGRVVGRGSAGPCNHVTGEEARLKFVRTIGECVAAARAEAGISPRLRFRTACFGMSGGPEDKAGLLREIVQADQWLVTHDGLIALSGALAGENGIVAIAGTGSFVFARNGSRTMRVGGWGYIFGDQGSAFWIVKQALSAALRYEEGWGPQTLLHRMLLNATGATSANQVLHLFYTPEWPRSRVARLAAEVDKNAESGDELAIAILDCAGRKLAAFAGAGREPLWGAHEAHGQPDEIAASYVGGVFRSRIVLERYKNDLRAVWNVMVRPPVWGADAGALLEAYRLAGIHPDLRNV